MNRSYAHELGLPDSGQDWGIEHADAKRLVEFVRFAASFDPVGAWDMEDLADLVFQSAEEALEDGAISEDARKELIAFIQERGSKFPHAIKYWSEGPDHFLIIEILREARNAI